MIIAVDFDGTLCSHKFPAIGEPNFDLINILRDLKAAGHQLILWSCRNGQSLLQAVDWARTQGLEFDAVNQDIPDIAQGAFGMEKSCKVYADLYIDDRNGWIDDLRSILSVQQMLTVCQGGRP
jgi:trehalose-6-phosphatase